MNDSTFVYVTYIETTPEKLWEALTSGEFTEKYFFGRRVESDWHEGARVTYWRKDGQLDIEGTVLACDRPRLLSFTWTSPEDTTPRTKDTRITFELVHMGSTVKLTLKHEDLVPGDWYEASDTFYGLNNGWPAIISNLKSLLETGRTLAAVVV